VPHLSGISRVFVLTAAFSLGACVTDDGPPPLEVNDAHYGECTDAWSRAVCQDDEPFCDAYPAESAAELDVCVPGCEVVEDCPVPPTGDATVTCVGTPTGCVLDCSNGETCPDGMECAPTNACMWPR
jgi:hypothetical protein